MQMLAVLVLALACVARASRLSDQIYTTLNGTTVCTRLLDESGEIGCSCLRGAVAITVQCDDYIKYIVFFIIYRLSSE